MRIGWNFKNGFPMCRARKFRGGIISRRPWPGLIWICRWKRFPGKSSFRKLPGVTNFKNSRVPKQGINLFCEKYTSPAPTPRPPECHDHRVKKGRGFSARRKSSRYLRICHNRGMFRIMQNVPLSIQTQYESLLSRHSSPPFLPRVKFANNFLFFFFFRSLLPPKLPFREGLVFVASRFQALPAFFFPFGFKLRPVRSFRALETRRKVRLQFRDDKQGLNPSKF